MPSVANRGLPLLYIYSLELAREEENRVSREGERQKATLSRHIVDHLNALNVAQEELQEQKQELSKVSMTIIKLLVYMYACIIII